LPKRPIHKTYVRKCKRREHNEEFPVQSPQQNEELVQYPEHHGELPLHPAEQNEESAVQSPEHHGELRVQYLDLVTNDEICVAITLKEFKGHVDRGHWEEVTGNEMEQTTAHFSIPQDILDRIPPKQLAIEYDCSSK